MNIHVIILFSYCALGVCMETEQLPQGKGKKGKISLGKSLEVSKRELIWRQIGTSLVIIIKQSQVCILSFKAWGGEHSTCDGQVRRWSINLSRSFSFWNVLIMIFIILLCSQYLICFNYYTCNSHRFMSKVYFMNFFNVACIFSMAWYCSWPSDIQKTEEKNIYCGVSERGQGCGESCWNIQGLF